jgi:DNA-binding transcriptional regulator YiaG
MAGAFLHPQKAPMTPTQNTLQALKARHSFSNASLAAYLGVPVPTLTKWLNGQRNMDSAPLRVVALLQLIENHAPDLHRALIDTAKGAPMSTIEPATVPPAPWVHVTDALPAWIIAA